MNRKGKFKTNASLKKAYFAIASRNKSGKLKYGKTLKFLKRTTNRMVRRMPIDYLDDGCGYKRLVEVADFNGDFYSLRSYAEAHENDVEMNHVVHKGGNHYFRK